MATCTAWRSSIVTRGIGSGALALAITASVAAAGDLRATVRDEQGRPVRDAVVVAVPAGAGSAGSRGRLDQVEQIDLEFVPGVKAIQAGTSVSFPNRDAVRHHVYSFSAPKRFELPLYRGTPAQPLLFDSPGVVTIGCNIHDWMVGYIYVAETPHFGVTGADGAAQLVNLPSGRYSVRVWHPHLAQPESATRQTLEATTAPAALEWSIPLKPVLRVRRAPVSGQGGRY